MSTKPIGVLALQGDFAAHGRRLSDLGHAWREVRTAAQLENVAGLIIPGGESTTLLKLIAAGRLEPALRAFHARGRPVFGTCAGVILLATHVTHPEQPSFGLLDVTVERNSYGRQVDSFEAQGNWFGPGRPRALELVFIRAPRITSVGSGVTVLASHGSETVLVQQGRVLGATFHPELTADSTVHRYFVDLCGH
jgi:5'-phosphate synthase pdxT subunit